MISSAQACGPSRGGQKCQRAGECCDVAQGRCVVPNGSRLPQQAASEGDSTLRFCAGTPYDAPPRTLCNPDPTARAPLTPCMRTNEPTTGQSPGRPMPCGPAVNARCAWRRADDGGDMCCVASQGQGEGPDTPVERLRGECRPCDAISDDDRPRVLIWDSGLWKLWG